jgi:hypothetical protein
LLISLLESQLANLMSADAVELLKQEHAEELQGLRAQAARVQELEIELTKTQEVESTLRLEFDHQLAKEREILSAKYDSEVGELCALLETKVESRDAKINELETPRHLTASSMMTISALAHLGPQAPLRPPGTRGRSSRYASFSASHPLLFQAISSFSGRSRRGLP